MQVAAYPHLLTALANASRDDFLGRKLLVCRHRSEGRELLGALARAGVDWVDFHPTTPHALAAELTACALSNKGPVLADEFEERALVDEALDAVLATAGSPAEPASSEADAELPDAWRMLAQAPGFRDAVADVIGELRMAGVEVEALASASAPDRANRRVLAQVLARYQDLLGARAIIDAAELFRRAAAALEEGASPGRGAIHLLPGLPRTGRIGRFLERLIERGARVLPADPVVDLESPHRLLWADAEPESALSFLEAVERAAGDRPEIDFFSAASPADEVKEVLRRVMAAGHRWDEVEIVATDPDVYGSALDTLARRIEIPVTYAAGLPVERTRPGRALVRYLAWIRNGFPADALRRLLESGDLAPAPYAEVTGTALARRLRRLRIGWGRDRYLPAVDRALAALNAPVPEEDKEDDGAEVEARLKRHRAELAALRDVLTPILEATPCADGGDAQHLPASPADVAAGALAFLEFLPAATASDRVAREDLVVRLTRIAALRDRPVGFAAAVGELEAELRFRVPVPGDGETGGSGSRGGRLHLTTVEGGGLSSRPATFVVGLDVAHEIGAGLQHPILSDADRQAMRRAVTGAESDGDGLTAHLATSAETVHERRHRIAALLARLRGSVTLSFSAWDAAEARKVAPAPVMLQALRLRDADPAADYERLYGTLGRTACPVPRGDGLLDGLDVWMAELGGGDVFRVGADVVRSAFPGLDAGLRARDARRRGRIDAHLGRIQPRPELLDPRRNSELVLSASRLETLGACPLRYFYAHVLRVAPPDEYTFDPDRWLDPLTRGGLLHEVYERSLRQAREAGIETDDDAFRKLATLILDEEVGRYRDALPVPGEPVYRREREALEADVAVFVASVRDDPRWTELEQVFGYGGAPDVALELPGGGTIRIRGRIDRIDEAGDGALAVIDYKTGSTRGYGRDPFNGGRRLQHVLYAAAARELLGRLVARSEYRFPTVKGRNHAAAYPAEELEDGLSLIEELLALVAEGRFLPTDAPDEDCRWCDYRAVCRVRSNDYGRVIDGPALRLLSDVSDDDVSGADGGTPAGGAAEVNEDTDSATDPLDPLRRLRERYA